MEKSLENQQQIQREDWKEERNGNITYYISYIIYRISYYDDLVE